MTIEQLREICQRLIHRSRVLGDWGFGRKLSLGKGINALFAGPSGTGKTMATEIIANELRLDLYKIESIRSGQQIYWRNRKNLDRVFEAAEDANAILFFDEADALFGKRSEVRDSHDRYANIEISYLLQKMEEYEGLAILATNLKANLDESFTRRLAFTVHFPFPDEASRRCIWEKIWPLEMSLDADVDMDCLARQFKLRRRKHQEHRAGLRVFGCRGSIAGDDGAPHACYRPRVSEAWKTFQSARACAAGLTRGVRMTKDYRRLKKGIRKRLGPATVKGPRFQARCVAPGEPRSVAKSNVGAG